MTAAEFRAKYNLNEGEELIETPDGVKRWLREADGCHRDAEAGPALELADGTKIWLRDGRLIRILGPARRLGRRAVLRNSRKTGKFSKAAAR